MTALRTASAAVAIAVATVADEDGLARVELTNPIQQVYDAMWQPEYPRIEIVEGYGSTETSAVAAVNPPAESSAPAAARNP